MQSIGRVKGIRRDYKTGRFLVEAELDHADGEALEELMGKDLDIKMAIHREKRSLNANAYFHVLVAKIAERIQADNQAVKNRLIREYGQYEYIADKIPTYLIRAEYEDAMMKREGVHFALLGYVHQDGVDYIKVAVMRGSHTYDTKEMARLINGTIEEARGLGIETMPPREVERMLEGWKREA